MASPAKNCDDVPCFSPRGYQLEMFRESMERNTIVVMGTGTGKTNVALLRIQFELQRTPTKLVWFTAPTKPLTEQQFEFLSMHLPEYQLRTLTGEDKVEFWSSQSIWDDALSGMNVVVSTPQVLFDALSNAFVSLRNISLLVIDEAHHAQKRSAVAETMRKHYHPLKQVDLNAVPHILGLTATSRVGTKSTAIADLEALLDSQSCTPTTSIDEYKVYANSPHVVGVHYEATTCTPSIFVDTLSNVVAQLDYHQDPAYLSLHQSTEEAAVQKLRKWERRQKTPATEILEAFNNNAQHLLTALGSWAADRYVRLCLRKWRLNHPIDVGPHGTGSRSKDFTDTILRPMYQVCTEENLITQTSSSKVQALIGFLCTEYHPGITAIIFVEQRSMAHALCELLLNTPVLCRYHPFAFVGHASKEASSFNDLTEYKAQKAAFVDFRKGLKNVCIATSVAEEGLDIPAVNVVIRFDDPKTLTALLQSRGRARKHNSKFVYFYNSVESTDRYRKLLGNEQEMLDEVHERMNNSEQADRMDYEVFHEGYVVPLTGAKLFYNNAVAHLQHFCAVTCRGIGPIYIPEGESGISMTARVILPSCLPLAYQEFRSLRAWFGEKAARSDAAYQAYKALHQAGLMTDHLVPFHVEKPRRVQAKHQLQNYEVATEYHVWKALADTFHYTNYRVDFSCKDTKYAAIRISLPYKIDHDLVFSLDVSSLRKIRVTVHPIGSMPGTTCEDLTSTNAVTRELFERAFGTGTTRQSLENEASIPILVAPIEGINVTSCDAIVGLCHYLEKNSDDLRGHPIFVRRNGGKYPRPYIWQIPTAESGTMPKEIEVKKIGKLRFYTTAVNAADGKLQEAKLHTWRMEDCETSGISTTVGPSICLVPSIIHMMAAALRAQHARETIFAGVGFGDSCLLTEALTATSASASLNYEILEFVGDAYLKYRTCLQIYHDEPLHMEGMLTNKVQDIVSNQRLEKSVREIGLETHITTQTPSSRHWHLPTTSDEVETGTRTINSKVLADVVESTLAAALLDGQKRGCGDTNSTVILKLYIPEIEWKTPSVLISTIMSRYVADESESKLIGLIEKMITYRFRHPSLLREALTHSALLPGKQSYDRLEFLGDAILDWIIKVKLAAQQKSPGHMTHLRHAAVSHVSLAYCMLGVKTLRHYNAISEIGYETFESRDASETIYLTDIIQFCNSELAVPIKDARERTENVSSSVEASISAGTFPWTPLRHIDAPKTCSDIFESLVAAVYLDSDGSLEQCERVIEQFGLFKILDTMNETHNFEARTPAEKLRTLCAKTFLRVQIKTQRDSETGAYGSLVTIANDQKEIVFEHRGTVTACEDEARSVAAEEALNVILASGLRLEPADKAVAAEDEHDDTIMTNAGDDEKSDVESNEGED